MLSKTTFSVLAFAGTIAAGLGFPVSAVSADWKPSGPINMMIAFTAGGGADTQARLIAAEIEKRRGWKIVPQNVTGKGGAVMARKLKAQPADGLSIGIAVTETFGYNMIAVRKQTYSQSDFTFITTTAGSQMALVAKADRGWKSIREVIAAAKAGKKIKVGAMSQKLADLTYAIGTQVGVSFNTVMFKGGRGAVNAVTAGDVDLGWGAGVQNKAIKAGTLVNVMSAEKSRLKISPDAPTMGELGVTFDAGIHFIVVGPKGLSGAARAGIASAIGEVLQDKSTKAASFVRRAFGGPVLISGDPLDKLIANGVADSRRLMAATN